MFPTLTTGKKTSLNGLSRAFTTISLFYLSVLCNTAIRPTPPDALIILLLLCLVFFFRDRVTARRDDGRCAARLINIPYRHNNSFPLSRDLYDNDTWTTRRVNHLNILQYNMSKRIFQIPSFFFIGTYLFSTYSINT